MKMSVFSLNQKQILRYLTYFSIFLLSGLLLMAPGTGDVGYFLSAVQAVKENGLSEGYVKVHLGYPPWAHLFFNFIAFVSMQFSIDAFVVFKTLNWVLYFLSIGIGFCFLRSSRSAVFLLSAIYIPIVGLGYVDIYYTPFLMAAYGFVFMDRPLRALPFMVVACLIKPLPWILAPFFVIYLFRYMLEQRDWEKKMKFAGLSLLVPGLLLSFTFYIFTWAAFEKSFSQAMGHYVLSANAPNINWLVQYMARVAWGDLNWGDPLMGSNFVKLETLPWTFGKFLFMGLYPLTLLKYLFAKNFKREWLVKYSLMGYLIFANLNIGVHENHIYVLPVLFFFLFEEYQVEAIFWTLILNLNMIYFYGYAGGSVQYTLSTFSANATIAFSFLATLFFIFHLLRFFWPKARKT